MECVKDTAATLIDSTVRVIARNGLDKASIRTISSDCQIPNPYIYQHFKDKDDLFVSSFSREDSILASEFLSVFLPSMTQSKTQKPGVRSSGSASGII